MQFKSFCRLLLTANGLVWKPNAASKTCVSGLQPEVEPTTGPILANARPLGKEHPTPPKGICSYKMSRYN